MTPTARILSPHADVLARELARLGVPEADRDAALAREHRCGALLAGLDAAQHAALHAAARAQGMAHFAHGGEALLLGPALLVREVARDLPPEVGAPLGAAADRFRAGPLAAGRHLRHARGVLDLARPAVMGVLNVTPDSFSDGGLAFERDAAIARGRRLAEEGAAIVDIGGESTRPGAAPVPLEEELGRVLPVVSALARDLAVPISIDTRKPEVARAALAAGASIVNDVSGLADPRMRAAVAEVHAGAVIMHMRGEPGTMQEDPRYDDVVGEVAGLLAARVALAEAAGVSRDAIAIDPGIGFGKTAAHNLELLRRLPELCSLGYPVLIGLSRKSTLGALAGGRPPAERLAASLAAAAAAVLAGAAIVRAHDVRETVDAVAVAAAVRG